jgi:hypothetical protein
MNSHLQNKYLHKDNKQFGAGKGLLSNNKLNSSLLI